VTYDSRQCAGLSTRLSDAIRDRIKALHLSRHKLVCTVVVGQHGGQAMRHASRCIWDADNDGFATASYDNGSLFATATVYAAYYD